MSQPLCLENLPRTVELERDGDGRPRLAYICLLYTSEQEGSR